MVAAGGFVLGYDDDDDDEYEQELRAYGTLGGGNGDAASAAASTRERVASRQRKQRRFQCAAAAISAAILVIVILATMALNQKDKAFQPPRWEARHGNGNNGNSGTFSDDDGGQEFVGGGSGQTAMGLPLSVVQDMDTSLDPCDDFYAFSCQNWQRKVKIPKDATEWTRTWDPVVEKNRRLLQEAVQHDTGIAGQYYQSCMQESLINSLGVKPLENFLNAVELIAETEQLVHILAAFHAMNVPCLFDWELIADPRDINHYAMNLIQGGLTLPDAAYYLSQDEETRRIRAEYLEVIYNVMRLTGLHSSVARDEAERVLNVETAIAQMFGNPEQERRKIPHHRFTLAELNERLPSLLLPIFFSVLTRGADVAIEEATFIVFDMNYFTKLEHFFHQTTVGDLKPYLRFRLAYLMGSDLSDDFIMQGLRLSQILLGVKVTLPRWKKCMESTNAAVPDAVGKIFVDKTLTAHTQRRASDMLERLRDAFRDELESTPWLQPDTRQKAIAKLSEMLFEVGAPKTWINYPFSIDQKHFFENVVAARAFAVKQEIRRLGGRVERQRWGQTKVTDVNAYYVREVNVLFVPAGVLQKPFFSIGYDTARNFGSLGTIMAHEMTHGFDDMGRLYGPQMKIERWWSQTDIQEFAQRAQCIAHLYGAAGESTLEEDIADVGAVRIAFSALESALRVGSALDAGHDGVKKMSRREAQLFFISWGQTWCSVMRGRAKQLQERTDEHAPDQMRVNPPLSQIEAFGEAFRCRAGDRMNPDKRCGLW